MLLSVSIGGHNAPWKFSGSKDFETWISDLPWLRSGGLCVIHTDGAAMADDLYSAVSHSIRTVHHDEGPLIIRRVFCDRSASPLQAILAELEISQSLGPFEAKAPLLASLRDRKAVFVLEEAEALETSAWDAFVGTLEHFGKSSPPIPLCVVVLDTRRVVYSQPVCDFSKGRPTHEVLTGDALQGEGPLWSAYMHQRIAWEAGGSLSYAKQLSDISSSILVGDDESFESLLTQASVDAGKRQGISTELLSYLKSMEASRSAAQSNSVILLGKGLLWRPLGGQSLRIVPWASRYLLTLTTVNSKWIWSLRNNLICGPLASEILVVCLHAESQIRTDLHGLGNINDSGDAANSQDRFIRGGDDYVRYPKAHPAPPNRPEDIWAFASLGETLRACPPQQRNPANKSVLHMRNCVSHGHYVAWSHVKLASNALRIFCS